MGKAQAHSSSLGLSSESMRTLKANVQELWSDYFAEFPLEQLSREVPGATLQRHAVSSAHHATEIRATSRVETEHEYQLRLAAWGQVCEKAVEDAVNEYMYATIVLIQCEYKTVPIEQQSRGIPFMSEPGL